MARLAVRRDGAPAPSTAEAEARRDEVLALVRAGFGPVRRRLLDRLHASTVRYMECRERVSLLMTEESYWMRRALLAFGAKLVERGTLVAPADVFFLFEDELERVLRDPAEPAAAAGRVAARKAELERDAALDPPETLCGGELSQNYPNPFNPTTAISYQLSAVSDVTLRVIDLLGREVATLVEDTQQPGVHTVRWDASRYPSGVYFYQLTAGAFRATKNMVLIK